MPVGDRVAAREAANKSMTNFEKVVKGSSKLDFSGGFDAIGEELLLVHFHLPTKMETRA